MSKNDHRAGRKTKGARDRVTRQNSQKMVEAQRKFEQQAKEVKEEFEEFQEGSKELEQELEAQLEQAEKSVKEFKSLANRLQIENDSLKDKLEQCNKEYHYQVRFNIMTTFLKVGFISRDLKSNYRRVIPL